MPPLYGLLFLLAARDLLYALSHKQDSTYHDHVCACIHSMITYVCKYDCVHTHQLRCLHPSVFYIQCYTDNRIG